MASVADQLREGRERQRLTVYDVAAVTKIRTDHVRALEEGNYSMFAAPVYIRGFVRAYARLLKLDEGKILDELDGELATSDQFRDPPSLVGAPRGVLDNTMLALSKVNWFLVVVVLAAGLILTVAIVGYRAWQDYQSRDPLEGIGSGLYNPGSKSSGETLPLQTTPPKQ